MSLNEKEKEAWISVDTWLQSYELWCVNVVKKICRSSSHDIVWVFHWLLMDWSFHTNWVFSERFQNKELDSTQKLGHCWCQRSECAILTTGCCQIIGILILNTASCHPLSRMLPFSSTTRSMSVCRRMHKQYILTVIVVIDYTVWLEDLLHSFKL